MPRLARFRVSEQSGIAAYTTGAAVMATSPRFSAWAEVKKTNRKSFAAHLARPPPTAEPHSLDTISPLSDRFGLRGDERRRSRSIAASWVIPRIGVSARVAAGGTLPLSLGQ